MLLALLVAADLHTALAFNVLYESKDDEASIRAIDESNADIVCLREMTPRFVKAVEAALGKEYPHRVMKPRAGTWGAGIMSKHPLSDAVLFPEAPHKIPALEATATIGATRLRIVCVHLFPPLGKHAKNDGMFVTMEKNKKLRKDQADYLIKRYKGVPKVLLLGDMNESPRGDALTAFAKNDLARACDVAPIAVCGNTWPGPAFAAVPALWEVDHIFGRGLEFREARVMRKGGSDHYPVIAAFAL